MPKNLTDSSAFTDPVSVPVDADPADAASVETPFQALANRTRFCFNALRVGHCARIPASEANYESSSWNSSFGFTINGNVVGSSVRFDFSERLTAGAKIKAVHVLLSPAGARASAGNRMQVTLYKVSHGANFATYPGPSPSAAIVATATDDGTANRQWVTIDLSGAPLSIDGGFGDVNCSWIVQVDHGADTGFDEVAVAVIEQTP